MIIAQIEDKLKQAIASFTPQNFLPNFLMAYGSTKAEISRLQKGTLNVSKTPGETILKKKLFFKEVSTDELETILPIMAQSKQIVTHKLRFVIVTDYTTLKAIDTKTKEEISLPVSDLLQQVTFFLPLAGMEKYQTQEENEADVKVAVQMAKLFDEIKKINPTKTLDQVHNLNIFLSRLLFCYFAEDTGIFTENLFTSSINNHTQPDGSDLQDYLQKLFEVLNTDNPNRKNNTPSYLNIFKYVNGGLFKEPTDLPIFNTKIRQVIIECGKQHWASINPDIFGSMIQAVVTPDQRGNLGMHYTSVPNIMKVIQPLFLDELYEEFEKAKNSPTALNKLLNRIANIRIFDPACGSGNFLIIAYKQLRLLEIKILSQLTMDNEKLTMNNEKLSTINYQLSIKNKLPTTNYQLSLFSRIELNHFYGIELDDFAHEIAKLSLWLAQHQMNMEFNSLLGATNPSLPLSDAGQITQGNATRLNWEEVCPKPKVGEVFILGNPPYLGAKMQSKEQKEDMAVVFKGYDSYKKLDFISCWFAKGGNYIKNSQSKAAFVSTNSICQGEQVGLLWPEVLKDEIEINFAYQSFKWQNNAKQNAGVTVVIIGLGNKSNNQKFIYNNNVKKYVQNINSYLADGSNCFVIKKASPLSNVPNMVKGNIAYDDGNLSLEPFEKDDLIDSNTEANQFIKKYTGSYEFINGVDRYCLWIPDNKIEIANKIGEIKKRLDKTAISRSNSPNKGISDFSDRPHKFVFVTYKEQSALLIPTVSSENRPYVPVGFIDKNTIATNATYLIYNPPIWLFSFLNSKMHLIWIFAVSGKLENRIRYSSTLCYNTFPFPHITQAQKDDLEQHTHNILKARANHTQKTLAEMYDPKDMPVDLRQAHQANDLAVEKCYRDKPFESDEERLAYLFNLYEQMIAEEKTKGTLFALEPKVKVSKKIKKK